MDLFIPLGPLKVSISPLKSFPPTSVGPFSRDQSLNELDILRKPTGSEHSCSL